MKDDETTITISAGDRSVTVSSDDLNRAAEASATLVGFSTVLNKYTFERSVEGVCFYTISIEAQTDHVSDLGKFADLFETPDLIKCSIVSMADSDNDLVFLCKPTKYRRTEKGDPKKGFFVFDVTFSASLVVDLDKFNRLFEAHSQISLMIQFSKKNQEELPL